MFRTMLVSATFPDISSSSTLLQFCAYYSLGCATGLLALRACVIQAALLLFNLGPDYLQHCNMEMELNRLYHCHFSVAYRRYVVCYR